MANEMIAVLDGIMPNPNTNQGWAGRHVNPSGSNSANYSGGSNYYPGSPTMPSAEGLAGFEQDWMDADMPGNGKGSDSGDEYAGYLAAFSASPYVQTRGMGDADAAAVTGYQGRSFSTQAGYVGQHMSPSGSNGANYSGGSNFFPGAPTLPPSEGLAALERSFGSMGAVPTSPYGYAGQTVNVSASGGANYSGGSNYFPGAPTLPSSGGLAQAVLHGLLGQGVAPVRAVQAVRASIAANRSYPSPAHNVTAQSFCHDMRQAAYQVAYSAAIMVGRVPAAAAAFADSFGLSMWNACYAQVGLRPAGR